MTAEDDEISKCFEKLPAFDENSPAVKADELLQEIIKCRNLAKVYDLTELVQVLSEILPTLNGKSKNHIMCQRAGYSNFGGPQAGQEAMNWDAATLRRKYSEYIAMLSLAFKSPEQMPTKVAFQLLVQKSAFDMQHIIASMQDAMMLSMRTKNETDPRTVQAEFERGDPIQVNLRDNEPGYKSFLSKARNCTSAQEADTLAKQAFAKKKIWSAEALWEKAIELDATNPKFFSNLSMVYTKIGRYLRSIDVGYRGLAVKYLEKAVATAKKGIAADSTWERSYQRGAEALLALGPYDHAIDALKLLKQAIDDGAVAEPSKALKELQIKARSRATGWLSLRVIPGRTTIPQIIDASIENLRKVILQSFRLCYSESPSVDDMTKAGDDIADALELTLGALQLIYLRRIDWELQSTQSKTRTMDIQIELREASKLVPLQTLVHSERLKKFAFADDTVFSLWGLDRLDRLNVDFLRSSAKDPCEKDNETPEMDEMMARATGEITASSSLLGVMEMIGGKQATSTEQDMANHHLCPFTMTLVERLILSRKYPALQLQAMKRSIELVQQGENTSLMGGEFLGRVTKCASGYLSYQKDKDASKFFEFIEIEGALATIAREITLGGDRPLGLFQQLLCKLTPDDWSTKSDIDTYCVLYTYALCALDGHYSCLKYEDIARPVSKILTNIVNAAMARDQFPNDKIVRMLSASSFGNFWIRGVIDSEPNSNPDVMHLIERSIERSVNRWGKLSKRKKSAYRWKAMSEEEQAKLSRLKPISKVEKFEKKQNREEESQKAIKKFNTITELPECAMCEEEFHLQQCPCKLVYYCGKECQTKHWKDHKAVHKKAMKASK